MIGLWLTQTRRRLPRPEPTLRRKRFTSSLTVSLLPLPVARAAEVDEVVREVETGDVDPEAEEAVTEAVEDLASAGAPLEVEEPLVVAELPPSTPTTRRLSLLLEPKLLPKYLSYTVT